MAALLMPSAALAEVMDKVSAPWEPKRLLPLAVVTAVCAVATRRPGRARTLVALVLAVTWAAAVFAFEDLYDPYIGPAIRTELSTAEVTTYRVLVAVEALIPLVVAAALVVTRMRRGTGTAP